MLCVVLMFYVRCVLLFVLVVFYWLMLFDGAVCFCLFGSLSVQCLLMIVPSCFFQLMSKPPKTNPKTFNRNWWRP